MVEPKEPFDSDKVSLPFRAKLLVQNNLVMKALCDHKYSAFSTHCLILNKNWSNIMDEHAMVKIISM